MSYIKKCNECGQRISMREMPAGQWVAFDPSTDIPHEHFRRASGDFRYSVKDSSSVASPPVSRDFLLPILNSGAVQRLLSQAKLESRVAHIVYVSAKGELTQREIEVSVVGDVYVLAFCRLRSAPRHFRVDRIKNVSLRTEVFKSVRYEKSSSRTGRSFDWIWWIVALAMLWAVLSSR